MISKASIRNFKCLRDVQFDLERFTAFVGPNASGKSSILQALDRLCQTFLVADAQGVAFGDRHQVLSQGANDGLEVAAEANDKAFRYRSRPSSNPATPPRVGQPAWDGYGMGVAISLATEDWKSWMRQQPGPTPLPPSVLLRLEASRLVQPNPGPDATVMSPDGVGLHSALANMALNDPDSWQELQGNLRRIIPTIRRLRHTKGPAGNQHAALLFDTVGADSVPANQVSEGTLLVLGLLTALHTSGRPNLVLLDDLDRGLHPRAQRELITLLRGLLETNSDLQIVATTHSPYMLDCMAVDEVRMTILNDDGATVCAPLTSHPNFPKWKDEMTPGEMWSLFGEKWVEEVTA
jgi:predicted ATPase